MTVLSWDKPAKAESVEEWKKRSADGAPPGVYTPNMSEEGMFKWKAKVTGVRKKQPQVEIRKSFGGGVQLLVIVGLDGYNYKQYTIDGSGSHFHRNTTKGFNVHMSMNGGAMLTFEDMEDLHTAVSEAKAFLQEFYPLSQELPLEVEGG